MVAAERKDGQQAECLGLGVKILYMEQTALIQHEEWPYSIDMGDLSSWHTSQCSNFASANVSSWWLLVSQRIPDSFWGPWNRFGKYWNSHQGHLSSLVWFNKVESTKIFVFHDFHTVFQCSITLWYFKMLKYYSFSGCVVFI